jgi:acyl-CoA reductase-like NAD-dependent aldehyde dehydrogenase
MHYPIKVPGAEAAGIIEVFSPYDRKPVGTVECIDARGAELALKNMADVFRDRNNWLPAHERIAILERAASTMHVHAEQLIATAIAEGGKPYSDTKVELLRAIDSIKISIDCIRSVRGTEIPGLYA